MTEETTQTEESILTCFVADCKKSSWSPPLRSLFCFVSLLAQEFMDAEEKRST